MQSPMAFHPFVDEAMALNHLTNLTIDPPPQATMQAEADSRRLNDLKNALTIRDKARLMAVSGSKEACAWLRAIPLPAAGLAIPPLSSLSACGVGSESQLFLLALLWLVPAQLLSTIMGTTC